MYIKVPAQIWSGISGILSAISYLILVDAQVYGTVIRKDREFGVINWIPAIVALAGWILLVIVPPQNLTIETDHKHDRKVAFFARGWTMAASLVLFTASFLGLALMVVELSHPRFNRSTYVWGSVVTFLHPLLVTLSGFIFYMGRVLGDKIGIGQKDILST